MPIALDPDRTFAVTLDTDAGKDNPPSFTFRYLTGRRWLALSECIDQLDEKKVTAAQMVRQLDAHLSAAVADWSGLPIPFDPSRLLDALNPPELYELAFKVLRRTRPDENDLKKSASPSPCATASSADPAVTVAV